MQTFVTREEISLWRKQKLALGQSVGFVPTMGALHKGHLSLVEQAAKENEVVVVSIFVNPKQFNVDADLDQYPRMIQADLELLKKFDHIVVFLPSESEMYPKDQPFEPMPLERIGQLMEGAHRPGHFEGVVHVVHHLFDLIAPNKAYFGQKDFQQLAVIRQLNAYYQFGIEIIGCQTIREANGLAMSSRNFRLNEAQREQAVAIYRALCSIKKQVGYIPIELAKKNAMEQIENAGLKLEYLEIVDPLTLEACIDWQSLQVCCIAAVCGEIRLIDNMLYESVL